MSETKNKVISPSDVETAVMLIPIITQLGIEAVKRMVVKNTMTGAELQEKAREYQEDTTARNEAFANRLEVEQ